MAVTPRFRASSLIRSQNGRSTLVSRAPWVHSMSRVCSRHSHSSAAPSGCQLKKETLWTMSRCRLT
ncbi:hypothetical protein M5D96_013737 [Drosophila gunungcola]|uniref:Uncharacterized protein n=1 Tax=Drosophila gunungcola TaxID=103775 RepID=A0A9P9YAV0_9MUSC|nr:hypothetical protein M5D96_013737 [Drosophila gunungcola]